MSRPLAACGTRSAYQRGCRCDDCRQANNTYHRAHDAATRPLSIHAPDEFGTLAVSCWCEADVVRVPVEDVKAGRTATCGRRECAG